MKKYYETLKITVTEIGETDIVRTSLGVVNDETDTVKDGYTEKWWEF
ncbi:MAG: hypothetical protein ACLTAN_06720 [Christensenellaceae bacterium]|nr:hypothetical protein [Bacillota bacterium]